MKMEIRSEKKNDLLCRTEVRFNMDHAKETTPGRNAVAEMFAEKYNTKRDCVVVDELSTTYGIGRTVGYVKVYDSKKAALDIENEHMLKRNGIEAPKKEEAPAEE